MDNLIVIILIWMQATFGFSVDSTSELPEVFFRSQEQLEYIYTNGDLTKLDSVLELIAFYDSVNNIIYLNNNFDIDNPQHQSYLAHELYHFFQFYYTIPYACLARRERAALVADDMWLEHIGKKGDNNPLLMRLLKYCDY